MWWLLVAGIIAYIMFKLIFKNTSDISRLEERCCDCVFEGKCTEDEKKKCNGRNN